MEAKTSIDQEKLEMTISKRELVIIEQALSEICFTFDLSDADCQNRLNASRAEVETLLEQISKAIGPKSS